jgi:allophanate hydrolase subunit 1
MKMNPNNNMNAYKQALQINRDLKRENDRLRDVIKEVDNFLIGYNVTNSEEDREIGRLQQLIGDVL